MTLWPRARRRAPLVIGSVVGQVACLVVGLMAVFPASARAADATAYVALGDSYASGVGAGSYDSASGDCRRSTRSYPALWAAGHQPVSFTFSACSGGTTVSVVASQLGGLNGSTQLVTLTVGGNDVGFVPVVGTCLVASPSACSSAVTVAKNMMKNVLSAELAATYAAIRALAPSARLVVLGYPRLFETTSTCGALGMAQSKRISLNSAADALDSLIAARAQEAGATFVDVRDAFAGHGICSGSPWINSSLSDVSNAYHPNAAGYAQGYLPALQAATGL